MVTTLHNEQILGAQNQSPLHVYWK